MYQHIDKYSKPAADTQQDFPDWYIDFLQTGNFVGETATYYDRLLAEEAIPPDPQEVMSIPDIVLDSAEALLLRQSGMSDEQIIVGGFSRQSLIDAGFAFINKIGGGEKPLIATDIEDGDGGVIDTASRILLTAEELEKVLAQQPKFTEDDIAVTRVLMINFILKAQASIADRRKVEIACFRAAQRHILDTGSEEEKAILAQYFVFMQNDGITLNFDMQRCIAGLDLVRVGAVPVSTFPARAVAIQGATSPFLNSGFHFGANDDITLFDNNPLRTRRLNSVTLHLLSRGLSESGTSRNTSHDQTYLTNEDFHKLMKLAVTQPEGDPGSIDLVATRLLTIARERE